MRLTVDKSELSRAAGLCKTALQAKSDVSHLCVIESDGKTAKVWGTDMTCYVEVALSATFEGEGRFSAPVESSVLANMAANASEKVVLDASGQRLKLVGGPKTAIPMYEYTLQVDGFRSEIASFPVNSELISTAIKVGSAYPTKESGRYATNGFGFRTVGSDLLVEATDGRRFYQAKLPTHGTPRPAICVAPAASMAVLCEISDFLDCKIGMAENALQIESGPLKFRTLLLGGSWPSDGIDTIFASLPSDRVRVQADSFFAKLANLQAVGFEKIFVEYVAPNLRFYCQGLPGESEWTIPAESNGAAPMKGLFSLDYLIDAKRLKMKNLEILYAGADNPYILRETGSSQSFYGLMGMEMDE